jgi:hypothetical protein
LTAADAVRVVTTWTESLFPTDPKKASALRPLLLQASCQRTSFHAVARRQLTGASVSWLETEWREWRGSQTSAEWEHSLDDLLRAPWQAALLNEWVWCIADWHAVPYWGRVPLSVEEQVRRGPAQSGTTRFFVYATVAVLWRGIRLQVAMTPVFAHESQAEVFARLQQRVHTLGCRILGWIMDKGFYATGVVALLRKENQPYLIAAPRRGEKEGIAALLSQAEEKYGFQEEEPPSLIQEYTLSSMDKEVSPQPTTVIIGWEPVLPSKKQRRQRTLRRSQIKPGQRWRAVAWISGGRQWSAKKARRAYAPRTGFESGYRLSKASRGRTSSRDPKWRLLLFAQSLLLQNAWIWLVIEGKRTLHRRWKQLRDYLPFIDFCCWMVRFLEQETGHRLAIDLPGV